MNEYLLAEHRRNKDLALVWLNAHYPENPDKELDILIKLCEHIEPWLNAIVRSVEGTKGWNGKEFMPNYRHFIAVYP